MGVHNGTADGKAQADPIFIQTAATVGLVKTVEQPGDLLRQHAGAGIAYRYHNIIVLGIKVEGKCAALVDKFYGVVHQIVYHLLEQVGIGQYPVAVIGIQPHHLDVLFLQTLLEPQQRAGHQPCDLHFGGLDGPLTRFDLAEGEHIVHQAGKPLDFPGNDTQVMVLPLGGNGAVQDTVDKAADGGHGGLQLVADIRSKAAPGRFGERQLGGHVIEGGGQPPDLIFAFHRHPYRKIALGKGAGRRRHLPQRIDQIAGDKVDDDKADHQHHNGRDEEHLQHIARQRAVGRAAELPVFKALRAEVDGLSQKQRLRERLVGQGQKRTAGQRADHHRRVFALRDIVKAEVALRRTSHKQGGGTALFLPAPHLRDDLLDQPLVHTSIPRSPGAKPQAFASS